MSVSRESWYAAAWALARSSAPAAAVELRRFASPEHEGLMVALACATLARGGDPADRERVARLATETADLLNEKVVFTPADILANADYLGGGYGVLGEGERQAVFLFARQEGLLLDPVYTGRAAAGMIDLIYKGFFPADQTVLFWHTGGAPALFAGKYNSLVERSAG